jgi:hypothetical protein
VTTAEEGVEQNKRFVYVTDGHGGHPRIGQQDGHGSYDHLRGDPGASV